ncbi:MAG: RES family NAD+ phosphorylase [Opitutaceae bacterium]|nr:RES family NAD+ phosphorylase [Opitutaceae bacterium]
MERRLRWPLDAAEFNRLKLPVHHLSISGEWWNLRWAAHLTSETVFHVSRTGRLTPESGEARCLYLASEAATSFHEIYGDDIAVAKESGAATILSKQELIARVFATAPTGLSLKVYDLSTEGSAKRIGMDLATLYTREIERPRRFAQRLHDHPERFDGIRFISRHTQGACMVLWPTHNSALAKMKLTRHSALWDHAIYEPGIPVGSVRLFENEIGVAAL